MTAMERPEPTLVPEWRLKTPAGTGSTSSSSSSNQHLGSSSRSDDRASVNSSRNRLSCSASDNAISRSVSSIDRTSYSNPRRSTSTNESISHDKDNLSHSKSYNSNRKYSDRERERDYGYHGKERPLPNGYDDQFDPFAASRADKGTLQRSQSMVARKQTEPWPKKTGSDMNNGASSTGSPVSSICKTFFDRDFPSLGSEEKQNSADIKRVSSPGLNTVSSSPFLCSSSVIGGDGWTSVLAEVPAMAMGNGTTLSSIHQSASATFVSTVSSTTNGLNMAETLVQAPLRARTAPEFHVETQRLEELAIKQSRQLIPVTPSMPKASALSSSDKLKSKGVKSIDIGVLPKGVPQPSTQLPNSTLRGPSKADASKASQGGNFQVLNRERNGLSITAKELQNPTNVNRVMNTLGAVPSVVTTSKKPSNPNLQTETKPSVSSMVPSSFLEKKPSPHAQNRNEFFNSLRKKTSINHSAATQEHDSGLPSEISDEKTTMVAASDCQVKDTSFLESDLDHSVISDVGANGRCNGFEQSERCKPKKDEQDSLSLDEIVDIPAGEEEYRLLKELGWNEDEEVELITQEEILKFYREHNINKEPSIL